MKSFDLGVIRDTHLSIGQRSQAFHSLRFGHPAISSRDDSQPMIGMGTKSLQLFVEEVDARQFQKGYNYIDPISTLHIALDLCIQRDRALSAGKKAAGAESRQGAYQSLLGGFQSGFFCFGHHSCQHLTVIHHLFCLIFAQEVYESVDEVCTLFLGKVFIRKAVEDQLVDMFGKHGWRFGFVYVLLLAHPPLFCGLLHIFLQFLRDKIFVRSFLKFHFCRIRCYIRSVCYVVERLCVNGIR
ncbi:hypothetical protein EVA_10733 [gut metagenome]|uniref:Uncharacterized protein n=1 Tax=gut metagenome TaxID=749906 RepID=J9CM46_9ZZZZ